MEEEARAETSPDTTTATEPVEESNANDDAPIITDPVASPEGEGEEPQQPSGEEDIQPAPNDDEAKATEEPEPVEDAGVADTEGAPDEKPTEVERDEGDKDAAGTSAVIRPSNPKAAMVLLLLLEGDEKLLEKKRKVKAEELINEAHHDSDVHEGDFFSLFYYDDCERSSKDGYTAKIKQKIFVDPTKQVKGQLYPNEKQRQPWKLHYGVKFFIPDPAKLKDDQSRFLYCLQLCDDIRNNLVRVDRETAIRLTALMLQGRIGDYDEESHTEGYTTKYPRLMLLPKNVQPDNYEAQVILVHKAKAGYSPAQADQEFLKIAKDLPRYGQHQFLATDPDGHVVTIGNGCKGISVYYNDSEDVPDQHIEWRNIIKISYKRRIFKIRYHPKNENGPDESRSDVLKFSTGSPPQAKRIWRNAVEQHTFFRLTEPETPSVISTIFRRGTSFRYSGRTLRQTMSDKKKQQPRQDFTPKLPECTFGVGRDQTETDGDWVILDRPPASLAAIDAEKLEHQKVVVDFRLSEGIPEDTRHYVIQRDKSGSYEVLSTGLIEDDKSNERSYYLSEVDENSKAATVSVSLNIDPPSAVDVSLSEQNRGRKGVTIFDSERMPVVDLGSASMVTTSTVIESDGRKLTTGEHSQRYPLEEVGDIHMLSTELMQWAGPAVDGSSEAKQVDLFLESEHAVMQKAFEEGKEEEGVGKHASPPPEVEVVY